MKLSLSLWQSFLKEDLGMSMGMLKRCGTKWLRVLKEWNTMTNVEKENMCWNDKVRNVLRLKKCSFKIWQKNGHIDDWKHYMKSLNRGQKSGERSQTQSIWELLQWIELKRCWSKNWLIGTRKVKILRVLNAWKMRRTRFWWRRRFDTFGRDSFVSF